VASASSPELDVSNQLRRQKESGADLGSCPLLGVYGAVPPDPRTHHPASKNPTRDIGRREFRPATTSKGLPVVITAEECGGLIRRRSRSSTGRLKAAGAPIGEFVTTTGATVPSARFPTRLPCGHYPAIKQGGSRCDEDFAEGARLVPVERFPIYPRLPYGPREDFRPDQTRTESAVRTESGKSVSATPRQAVLAISRGERLFVFGRLAYTGYDVSQRSLTDGPRPDAGDRPGEGLSTLSQSGERGRCGRPGYAAVRRMLAYPVSRQVNSPNNDDAKLIEPEPA
jgi:hypothetical protein